MAFLYVCRQIGINQRDWVAASQELRRWVYGGGRVLPGLLARREAEAHLLSA
jgi:lysozyme